MRTALLLSFTLALSTMAMAASETTTAPTSAKEGNGNGESPYSKKAQAKKEKEQEDQYFKNRDKLGKVEGVLQELGNETDIQVNEDPTIMDDEKVKSPSKSEATKPTEPLARKAQKRLQTDLKAKRVVDEELSTEEEGEEILGSSGKPDNIEEFAVEEQKKHGHRAPGINPKEFEKFAPGTHGSWAAGA